jgi:glycosyltransferase involved in cell wall biosynthesis
MRVALDLSVVGLAHHYPHGRTGVFRVVERLARGLAGSPECEVTFVAPQSVEVYNWCAEHLAADPRLPLARLAPPPVGARALRALGRRAGALAGAGAPLARRAARRALWTAYWGLHGALGVLPPPGVRDAEVYHSPLDPLPPPRRTGRARRFLTVYDLVAQLHPEWLTPALVAAMHRAWDSLRPDDWVVTISEATRADLCALRGMDPARVFVTLPGADPEVFHPVDDPEEIARVRARYGIPEGPYLLSLNTLEPRKNLDHALRAFAALVRQEKVRDLSFVLVGGRGWKYEGILAALDDAGAARGRVVLAGFVPDADLAALYGGATAFVYPSLYEGFGLPPLEAMGCGVPVIASNTSSLPEVVGDAGIMVDPRDGEALSQAMLSLYRGASLRRELAARSLARAASFTWERFTRQTVDAYRTALSA